DSGPRRLGGGTCYDGAVAVEGGDKFALSLARLRYVLGEGLPAEVEVEFHPLGIPATAAQGTALTEGDAIWLLAYRDDNQTLLPFDQEAMQAWRRELEAVHGPAAELLTLEFQGTESVSLWRIGRQAPPR
ncbi:MAG: hypothetical protein ACPGQD_07915, partial [Planctomycetota bacterium]